MLSPVIYSKLPLCAVTVWLILAGFGFSHFWSLDSRPGPPGHPLTLWRQPGRALWRQPAPALDPVKPTLMMLVHPQCPCSRASVSELNCLAALCPNQAKITVLFLQPAGYPAAWTRTALWRQASAIPGVTVLADENGEIAQHSGAATSGETLLYAPDGHLLFHGGLTGARGHEGDNAGLAAVAALLHGQLGHGQRSVPVSSPVYGCSLMTSQSPRCAQTGKQNRGERVKREGNP